MNERSSRSHSVFTLKVKGFNPLTEEKCEAMLNLGKSEFKVNVRWAYEVQWTWLVVRDWLLPVLARTRTG
jgi:hypothetical protein